MKRHNFKFLFILISLILFGKCSDDILDQTPKSEITRENFFTSENDFKIYSNQFYDYFPREGRGFADFVWREDNNSDNQLANGDGNIFAFGANTINNNPGPYGGGGWSFANIRVVNYYLDRLEDSPLTGDIKARWEAEGRFFRAYLYFDKVRKYGDVPWFDQAYPESAPEIFKARDPRATVIGNIMADLDFAIANLPQNIGGKTRLDTYVAQALKARIALYEGTYRKYHGFSEPSDDLLNQAAQAAKIIMDQPGYVLHSEGGITRSYYNYFTMEFPGESSETILARHFSNDRGVTHWSQRFIDGPGTGFSKSFADDYLCTDGLPVSLSPLFDEDTDYDLLSSEMANRDGRMTQTIWSYNDQQWADPDAFFTTPRFNGSHNTGYSIKKWTSTNRALLVPGTGFDGIHLFRLGEIYLIYAEAKAELGTITQNDLDISINKLRDRVGMAHMELATLQRDPDSDFDGSISGIPSVSVIIDEVRRERRIELAAEGIRRDDIHRWKAGQLLVQNPLGAKFNPEVYPNAVGLPFARTNADGFIEPYQGNTRTRQFDENKNYLFPIPPSQIGLYPNGELKQNPGW